MEEEGRKKENQRARFEDKMEKKWGVMRRTSPVITDSEEEIKFASQLTLNWLTKCVQFIHKSLIKCRSEGQNRGSKGETRMKQRSEGTADDFLLALALRIHSQ